MIVSTTHTHAAPVTTGIWGTTDQAYMQKLSEAAVAAVDKATADMKPSEIWTANGNVRSFVWQNGQGTNHPDGFAVDEQLPIMWARDPDSGATNALYANVPNHPDQFNGTDNAQFSADWPGYARAALDGLNGGTSVIAAGTLGRQEPPGDVDEYSEVIPQGEFVVNAIQLAMAKATPLTEDTVAGTESYMNTLADNEELLFGISLWGAPGGSCFDEFELCTIPRSDVAPYFDDANDHLGTHVPSVRIGDVLYSTNPGEAFPEVNAAISNSVSNARSTNVVGMAGDMLGYYYQRGDYTEQEFGSSDFERFNVGPDLAQDNANLGTANAAALGFATTATGTVFAPHDATVEDKPGVQFYPDQVESSDPTINFYGSSARSQDEAVDGRRGHQLGLRRWHDRHDGVPTTLRPHVPRTGQLRRDRDGDRLERQDPFVVADDRHRSAACAQRRADLPLEQEGQPLGDEHGRTGHARLRSLDLPGRHRGERPRRRLPRKGEGPGPGRGR